MIINCEECGKRYRIDENKIKGERARLKCKACGNIMEVTRPQPNDEPKRLPDFVDTLSPTSGAESQRDEVPGNTESSFAEEKTMEWTPETLTKEKGQRPGGLSIGLKLLIMFVGFVVVMGSVLTFVYLKYVPSLMADQISLRTYSISRSFSAAVLQPLLVRNYLRVNKSAEIISQLPGVAYVSVINKRGIVIAGIFGDLKRFPSKFAAKVKQEGFPTQLSRQNLIPKGKSQSAKDLSLAGQKIHDVAVPIGDSGAEAHVGLFTEDVEKAVRESLTPLLMILAAMAILGGLSFFLVARTISRPIRSLTDAAQRISLGQIDLPIEVKGGGEIAALSVSLERMRFSIKSAIGRLRRR
jgi:predicted Zn finger-like uncharacterized protein